MKEEKDFLEQFHHRDGMTVPDGYFADFAARMAASLPATPYEQSVSAPAPRIGIWHRVRPYVYMAAMFMGVWCMLKMFTLLTTTSDHWEPSPVLAEALGNEIFVNEYIIDDINQWELIDDLYDEGIDPSTINDEALSAAETTPTEDTQAAEPDNMP